MSAEAILFHQVDRQHRWQAPRARILSGSIQRIRDINVKRNLQVQVQGRARARGILVCPLTNQPVIGYRIRIQTLTTRSPEVPDAWETVIEITRMREFEIYDDTGSAFVHWLGPLVLARSRPPGDIVEALVRPEFYEAIDADMEKTTRLMRFNPEDGRYLVRESLEESNHLRCWATTIEHNTDVFVCGRPVIRLNSRGESAGYREAPNPLVIRSTGGHPLLLANCTKKELIETINARLMD